MLYILHLRLHCM